MDANDIVVDNTEKHYAMGRLGARGIAVMQDGFNVYLSGGNGGLYRFRPAAGSFESGELFAAAFTFNANVTTELAIQEGDTFDIKWISIGENDAEDVAEFTSGNEVLNFTDMFKHDVVSGASCSGGFELVTMGGEHSFSMFASIQTVV